ncbi:muscarinic acetylcholine receptor M4-like [Clytia hemisphaerica]|uniref:muscarinic acetylcholine receptor M4-like n=1 Tax=Clytia hemisphaerica TaxID=252671 RepID=UPI0034D6A2D5
MPYIPETWEAILIGISSTILSLGIIFGNTIVIKTYFQNTRLQVAKHFYIVSLAIADLLVALVPLNIYTGYLVHGKWPFGGKVCSAWLSLDHILFTISNISVIAIAVERFLCICFPIYHRINFKPKLTKTLIGLTWVASIFIWAPAIIIYPRVNKVKFDPYRCKIIFYQYDVALTITVVVFSYIIPVIILVSVYVAISMRLLKLRKNRVENMKKNLNSNPSQIEIPAESQFSVSRAVTSGICNVTSGDVDHKDENRHHVTKKDRVKAERRTLKLLFFIALAFILSWMPYHLTVIIEASTDYDFPDQLWNFCYIIGRLNSFLNPICYAFGNSKFKQGFKKSLGLSKRKKQ